jgi:hypothetical protein
MSTTRKISIAVMIIGLVGCSFLLGIGVTLWLAFAFIASFGLILLVARTVGGAPIMYILTFLGGIGLFWWLFGWQAALAYFLLSWAFARVQPSVLQLPSSTRVVPSRHSVLSLQGLLAILGGIGIATGLRLIFTKETDFAISQSLLRPAGTFGLGELGGIPLPSWVVVFLLLIMTFRFYHLNFTVLSKKYIDDKRSDYVSSIVAELFVFFFQGVSVAASSFFIWRPSGFLFFSSIALMFDVVPILCRKFLLPIDAALADQDRIRDNSILRWNGLCGLILFFALIVRHIWFSFGLWIPIAFLLESLLLLINSGGSLFGFNRAFLAGEFQPEEGESHAVYLILVHLLKLGYRPGDQDERQSWEDALREYRRRLPQRFRHVPLPAQELTLIALMIKLEYPVARAKASDLTGLPPTGFPNTCEWTPEQVVDQGFLPSPISASASPSAPVTGAST